MAVEWRTAESLDVLLGQINARYSRRSKAADGAIGDAEHASRASDHNPWYWYENPDPRRIVTARDITHDPGPGVDCHQLAAWLVASGDPRIKYVIWDGRIWERETGWQTYYGANDHTHHLHLSVVASSACDDVTPWRLGGADPEEDDVRNFVKLMRWQGAPETFVVTPWGHWLVPNYQALRDFADRWDLPRDARGNPTVEAVSRTAWFGPRLDAPPVLVRADR